MDFYALIMITDYIMSPVFIILYDKYRVLL